MPLTKPEQKHDYTFIFNNKHFPISKCLFGLYSETFRNNAAFVFQTSLDVTEPGITNDEFSEFINACQGRFYQITLENCFQLLCLAQVWKVAAIEQEISSYISNIDDFEHLVKKLLFNYERNTNQIEYHQIEESIAKKINLYLPLQSFAKLPISVLHRILYNAFSQNQSKLEHSPSFINRTTDSKIDMHLLYLFLIEASKHHNESIGVLFSLIDDYGDFTSSELSSLFSCVKCSDDFIRKPIFSKMESLFSILNQQQDQINELRENLQIDEKKETNHLNKIDKKVSKIEKTLKKERVISGSQNECLNYEQECEPIDSQAVQKAVQELEKEINGVRQSMDIHNDTIKQLESRFSELDSLYNQVQNQFYLMRDNASKPVNVLPEPHKKKNSMIGTLFMHKDQYSLSEIADKHPNHSRKTFSMKEPDKTKILLTDSDSFKVNGKNKKTDVESSASIYDLKPDIREINCPITEETKPLHGIFNYLNNFIAGGGNIHNENIVNIQASSSYTPTKTPDMICDFKSKWFWRSMNEPNQWIKFDFTNWQINIQAYSIKTIPYNANNQHLKSWVLEGTNAPGFTPQQVQDNDKHIEWNSLDTKNNNSELNGCGTIATFNVSQNSQQFFRYIRLRMTGPNHFGQDTLALTNIEFYGTLKMFIEST